MTEPQNTPFALHEDEIHVLLDLLMGPPAQGPWLPWAEYTSDESDPKSSEVGWMAIRDSLDTRLRALADDGATTDSVDDVQKALREAADAAHGDSNDGEIDALQDALDHALTRWPEIDRDQIQKAASDAASN